MGCLHCDPGRPGRLEYHCTCVIDCGERGCRGEPYPGRPERTSGVDWEAYFDEHLNR